MPVVSLSTPQSIYAKTPIASRLEVTEPDAAFTAFKLLLQVWVETTPYSDEYVFLAELEDPVGEDFTRKFFIESKLREALAYELPTIGGAAVQLAPNVCRRYKLKYGVRNPLSMELVDEFYHRGSGYVKIPMAAPLVVDQAYGVIAYTGKLSAIADVQFFQDLSTADVNFLESGLLGNRAIAYTTIANVEQDELDELSIPPNIKFELYKNPIEFTDEATVFGALLGGESLKSFGFS